MKELQMPPSRVCSICLNRMNEVCLEGCASENKYKEFDPDMGRSLDMLPTLSFREYMELPGTMKGKWLFVVQTKIIQNIKGEENEYYAKTRPYYDHTAGGRVSSAIKIKGVLPGAKTEDTPHTASEECEDIRKRFNSVDQEKP